MPEADRQEQEIPAPQDPRPVHNHPAEVPDADALEQETSVAETDVPVGIDAEREEPVSDDDWGATSPASEG